MMGVRNICALDSKVLLLPGGGGGGGAWGDDEVASDDHSESANTLSGSQRRSNTGSQQQQPPKGGANQPSQANAEADKAKAEAERLRKENEELRERQTREDDRRNNQSDQQSERERLAADKEEAINDAAEVYRADATDIINGYKQCKDAMTETEKCCAHPEKCLGSALGESGGENSSMALKALQLVGGVAGAYPGSIGAVCGRMKTVAVGFAAINSALALKCESSVRQCKSTCDGIADRAQLQLDKGTNGLDATSVSKMKNLVADERSRLRSIADSAGNCSRYSNASAEKAMQAISSAYAAKMADMCKQQASNMPNADEIARNMFNVDCNNSANAANPICQNNCSRQGWQNDPVCRQLAGLPPLGSETAGNNGINPVRTNTNSPIGLGLDDPEDRQEFEDGPNAQANKNGINQGQGAAGMGGGGGGGDGGGGGGFDGGGGGGGAGGHDTNILTGIRTGGGFSNPVLRSSSGGGYRAATGSGARAPANVGKPFNPRDYLPGGRLDPKRKLAGLASATPDIGAVHGNIFKNITNRFYEVCMRDALYDCATLRKRGRQGN